MMCRERIAVGRGEKNESESKIQKPQGEALGGPLAGFRKGLRFERHGAAVKKTETRVKKSS